MFKLSCLLNLNFSGILAHYTHSTDRKIKHRRPHTEGQSGQISISFQDILDFYKLQILNQVKTFS